MKSREIRSILVLTNYRAHCKFCLIRQQSRAVQFDVLKAVLLVIAVCIIIWIEKTKEMLVLSHQLSNIVVTFSDTASQLLVRRPLR